MNLILGTANFNREGYGKKLEKDECFRILDRAKELGIKTLATAFDYGTDVAMEHGLWDMVYKYDHGKIKWGQVSGFSLETPETYLGGLIMASFNPLDHRFKYTASEEFFIARSIFCGGRLQRSNKEDVARLCFGFLRSHDVKNAVFGVESIEELELNVRVADEIFRN